MDHARPLPHAPGEVTLSPTKILWNGGMLAGALAALTTPDPLAIAVTLAVTPILLGFGHSVGLHRGVIHGAFAMGVRTERVLVYLATLTGIGGPVSLLHMHDTRDDHQNTEAAPSYYSYEHSLVQDAIWYLFSAHHGETHTHHPDRAADPYYLWLERTKYLQQLPWAILLFLVAGVPGVLWGVCVRNTLCIYGHWYVNYRAHTSGYRTVRMPGSGEEGRNHLLWGPLAMGEGWHNNHHAWPASANFGVRPWEIDPGWWIVRALAAVGLVWNVKTWESGAPLRAKARLAEG